MNDLPLVSCIMPTKDRRAFVEMSIRCFLAQDYAGPIELIVLDDGRDRVATLALHNRIRYFGYSESMPLFEKFNKANEMANGSIIVHWDDDDWSASWRVSYQVGQLLITGAGINGLDRVYFYDALEGQAWLYPSPYKRPWIAGGTFCYPKGTWARTKFTDAPSVDQRWIRTIPPERIQVLKDPRFYLASIHFGNSNPRRTHLYPWQSLDTQVLKRLVTPAAIADLTAATKKQHAN